jgi:glycine cleavage system T protein (aminomethyltransferase)
MTELRRTPLAALHERLGGRMVPFAGFSMPVQYTSIVEEHRAARETAALFDVSHMGQVALSGPAAGAHADRLCTRAMSTLGTGRVRYALLCNEAGGVIDDVTVYRTGDDAFFLCVNAANTAADLAWIQKHAPAGCTVRDESEDTGLLALQGPASAAVLAAIGGAALGALKRFSFARAPLAGCHSVLASRTGYTGADGFELYCTARDAAPLFEELLDAGRTHGLLPAGLGARDTLRLEAALPLYGQELDADTTPLEAGLGRFVELDRDFLGADAIRRRRDAGFTRTLVGFEVGDRGIARAGYPVLSAGERVGRVTSGGPSPTLSRAIGLAYVPIALSAVGSALEIEVRGRAIPARVVETPFVSGMAAGRPKR